MKPGYPEKGVKRFGGGPDCAGAFHRESPLDRGLNEGRARAKKSSDERQQFA